MAGKDDFFGNGSSGGESEEASLDDFFQPAVTEQPAPPPPPKPAAAPPPPPPPTPTPPAEPEPPSAPEVVSQSFPEAQPFPEVSSPRKSPSLQPPPASYNQPEGDTLFPIEKGADIEGLIEEASDGSEVETAEPADEGTSEAKPGLFSRIPRVAIIITIAVITAAMVGVGGYFAYNKFIASKKEAFPKKKTVATATPSTIVPKEVPAVDGSEQPTLPEVVTPPPKTATPARSDKKKPSKAKVSAPKKPIPTKAVVAPKKPEPKKAVVAPKKPEPKKAAVAPKKPEPKKAVVAPDKKTKPYNPKPLAGMPSVKSIKPGAWVVHLERLALETTLAKDAQIVRKAGFEPFKITERRVSMMTEYRLVAEYPNVDDAHEAAWKADELGYRPVVSKKGRMVSVILGMSFSQNTAEKMRKELESKGFGKVRVEKVRSSKKLQALRAGPFKSEAEAQNAANKLKGSGFPNAIVMRSR